MKKKKKKKYRLDGFHVALVKEALFWFFFFVFLASIFSACQKDFQFACSRKRNEKEKKEKKKHVKGLFISEKGCKTERGHFV